MKIFLKLFTALVTNLTPKFMKHFDRPKILLSLYYTLITIFVIAIFSTILIYTIETKIQENFDGKIILIDDKTLPERTSNEIEFIIYVVDGVLIVLVAFSSYILASRTLNPLRKALEIQKKFSADASHDLRTPLAIITTESEVVLRHGNSSKKDFKKVVESNLEEVKKMTTLVNDLLFISRGENLKQTKANLKLSILIINLVEKMKSQMDAKNLELVTNIDSNIFVKASKDLERAVQNILQNAINYTKVGTITVELKKEMQKTILTISDTGVGISKNDLPKIFDRFYKAENSRNDNSGSGLGLAIAKEILEQDNGQIEIKSEINKGTTVEICLN